MSVAQTVVKNASAGVAAQMAIKVLSFGFTVLVVRQLGAEQFGQYAAVQAFGAMFVFLADLGLSVYVVREVSRWRTQPDGARQIAAIFSDSLVLRLVLSCIAAGLLMLTAIATDRPFPMLVALAIGAVGLVVYNLHGTCEAILSGFERLDVEAVARVVNQLTFVLLGALALWIGAGYHGLAVASLVGAIVMTGISLRAARRLGVAPGRATPAGWLGLLRASAPFAVIAGTLGLSYKFDSVLLNVTRGDAENGYYNAAYSLVFASVFLSNAVNTALYPSMTRQFASDPASLPGICSTAIRYLMILAVPIAVGGWVLSDQIVMLLFGDAYGPASTALAILIWVVPLMFASEFLGYVVVVRGQEGRVARAVLVSTAVNVGCNLLLVPWFGLTAAAIMTVVTEAVLVSQYLWALRSLLASIAWGRTLGRTLLAALVMGGLALLLRDLPVVAAVVLAGLAYGLLLLGLGVVGRDDLAFVISMRRRSESEAPAPAESEPAASPIGGVSMHATTAEPKVGIVILNWNRPADTIACVESLRRMEYANYEVVLVDNASRDDSVARLRAAFPDVHLIANRDNLGFSRGSNVGIAHLMARGCQYVMLLNDDAEVGPDTVGQLVAYAEQNPDVGIVGPTICYFAEPRVIWSAGGSVTSHGEPSHLDVDQDVSVVGSEPRDVAYVTGCAILVQRAVVERIGVLDDRFFAYFEETEWCARALKAGFRIVHVPSAVMWHKVTRTARATTPLYQYLMARNRLLYLRCVGAGVGAIVSAGTDLLRTALSWRLRPQHRAMRGFSLTLVRGVGAFAVGRFGPPPANL